MERYSNKSRLSPKNRIDAQINQLYEQLIFNKGVCYMKWNKENFNNI